MSRYCAKCGSEIFDSNFEVFTYWGEVKYLDEPCAEKVNTFIDRDGEDGK